MSRTRRSAIVLCLAIVLCAALMPAPFLSVYAILVPLWPLFQLVPRDSAGRVEEQPDQQPAPFLSLLVPRAPPA